MALTLGMERCVYTTRGGYDTVYFGIIIIKIVIKTVLTIEHFGGQLGYDIRAEGTRGSSGFYAVTLKRKIHFIETKGCLFWAQKQGQYDEHCGR